MLIDFLVELLGSILWSEFGQDRARLEKLPAARQHWQLWLWVVGGVLFFVAMVAVYSWSSGSL